RGLAALGAERQALRAVIGGAERPVALVEEGGLAADLGGAGAAVRCLFRRLVHRAELVVQADADLMQVVQGIVACRRRGEGKAAETEAGVEILAPRRPARIPGTVDTAAQHVAQPDVAGVGVLVAGREVGSGEARAG